MSRRPPVLAEDAPWRAPPPGQKPFPRISQNPVLRVPQNPTSAYAVVVMKHANPIGEGFATEARLEAAGPECIVPGQVTPIKLLGLKMFSGAVQKRLCFRVSVLDHLSNNRRKLHPENYNRIHDHRSAAASVDLVDAYLPYLAA